jgi:hypothetical protein
MLTPADFLKASQWFGIAALAFLGLTLLAFVFRWGIRFRLVGVTSFTGVLTAGLFALSLTPFMRTVVPGAAPFTVVYDGGATQAVIAVAPKITESVLEATLRQAASNLFSSGRLQQGKANLTIRARTLVHPEPGVSKPVFLGQVQRSLTQRDDPNLKVEIFSQNLAQLNSAQ